MPTKTTTKEQTPKTTNSDSLGFLDHFKHPKTIVLLLINVVLVICSSLALWYFSSKILSPVPSNLLTPVIDFMAIVYTVLAYIGSLGVIMFLTLSVTNRWLRLICFFLFVVTYPLFFGFSVLNMIVTILLYAMFVTFDSVISFDINLHTKLALFHIYNPRLLLLVTVFSFLLTAQLWVSANRQSFDPNISIPRPWINQTISFALPIIKDNIEEQLIIQVEQQLPFLKDLSQEDKALLIEGTVSPAVRDRLYQEGLNDEQINAFAEELTKTLSELNLGGEQIENNGSFSVDTIVQQAVQEAENLLNEVITTNKEYLPWIISMVGFFILNSAGYILHFFALFITQIFLFIAVRSGLLKKVSVQTTAERYINNI